MCCDGVLCWLSSLSLFSHSLLSHSLLSLSSLTLSLSHSLLSLSLSHTLIHTTHFRHSSLSSLTSSLSSLTRSLSLTLSLTLRYLLLDWRGRGRFVWPTTVALFSSLHTLSLFSALTHSLFSSVTLFISPLPLAHTHSHSISLAHFLLSALLYLLLDWLGKDRFVWPTTESFLYMIERK